MRVAPAVREGQLSRDIPVLPPSSVESACGCRDVQLRAPWMSVQGASGVAQTYASRCVLTLLSIATNIALAES